MRRREFITVFGGAAAWPLAARAQQREQMRRIGVLMNLTADDAEGQGRLAAFMQGLQEAGWSVGRNVRVDLRWGGGRNTLAKVKADTEAATTKLADVEAQRNIALMHHDNILASVASLRKQFA